MKEYKLAVFIGRFQPFHTSHADVVNQALGLADQVLIILGSHKAAPTVKNPFRSDQRMAMIAHGVSNNIWIDQVRDYYSSDYLWVSNIQSIVQGYASRFDISDEEVVLIANYKDDSSYYLSYFPQWNQTTLRSAPLDATLIRQILFNPHSGSEDYRKMLPEGVFSWLDKNYIGTPAHVRLIKEAQQVEADQHKYGKGPFLAVDPVVVKSGHVLMVRRGGNVGNGLLALPGGFANKLNERMSDACIRELKEETHIDIDKAVLKEKIKTAPNYIFDHPGRDVRGRIISRAYFLDLGKGPLPRVKGSDDAASALWIPLMDLNEKEDEIYGDHAHIINHFIKGGHDD